MNYSIRRPLSPDERNALSAYSDILAHLLFHRGITDANLAEKFISPDYNSGIHDPFLLKDAEKAAERIINAIENQEKIAIYADYDADGIPGAVMFDDFFKRIGYKNFVVYIPHRHDEGFGVNENAVRELAEQGVKLMITIDCGSTDVKPIKLAKELGMEVIITDHHEPPAELPPALAIVNHKQKDCGYPDKNLCGSGVAYKLIQAILKMNRFSLKEGMEKWFLDLVGISTLSDMVPLTGENRIFAHYGLQVLRKSPRKGIMRLLHNLRMNQRNLSEDDVAFMITPRINAASRMGVPMDAFNLLAADNDDDAYRSAEHLEHVNNERKGVVASLVKEIKKTIKERSAMIPNVIVLGNPAWRPSLLGLAANSCAEEFDRPVFLWGRDGDNVIKGSCRSEGVSNVVEIMRLVPSGIFEQFGGHKHSGGFSVINEQVHYLEQRLNEAFETMKNSNTEALNKSEALNSDDQIDLKLTLEDIGWHLNDEISKLAPFGIGNPKPLFLFGKVIPKSVRTFGKANDHVELMFIKNNGEKIPAISFFGAADSNLQKVKAGQPVDLIASLEKSTFRGKTELRLRIDGITVC